MLNNCSDLAGVGFQCSSEEGLPERSDALWDATSGCLHNPVAGQRLAWQIREGVQVSFSSFSVFLFKFTTRLCNYINREKTMNMIYDHQLNIISSWPNIHMFYGSSVCIFFFKDALNYPTEVMT